MVLSYLYIYMGAIRKLWTAYISWSANTILTTVSSAMNRLFYLPDMLPIIINTTIKVIKFKNKRFLLCLMGYGQIIHLTKYFYFIIFNQRSKKVFW